ncbi:hypothetical protein GCM10010169_64860 [Micromonospora fulviviridis]|nr:hypothetical protein GCM10010169_64860 [Micromonospora fulviviridis]
MVATTAGGSVACVTPCSFRNAAKSAPRRRSGGTVTSAAPDSNASNHSSQNMSKPTDANCATRAPGPTPNRP